MRPSRRSPSYTVRNPYSYCFRMIVPTDLRKFVGKSELRYTLNTGSIGLAKSKARLLAGKFQQLFRFLRENQQLAELTNDQIKVMVAQYIQNALKMLEERWLTGDDDFFPPRDESGSYTKTLDFVKDDLIDELNAGDYQRVEEAVDDLLEKNEISGLQKDSYSYKKLCRELLKAEVKLVEIEKKQMLGDYSDDEKAAFSLPSDLKPDQTVSLTPVEKPSIPLKDVIDEYKKRKVESGKWRPGVIRNHIPKIRTMLQVFGNRPVNYIKVEDARVFAKLLELLPPGFARLKDYEDISGLTPEDLKGKHKKTLDVTTRIGYLNFARSIFEYALDADYIKKNPVVSGLIPPKKKNTRELKLPFDDPEDLDRIFNHSAYLKACKDRPSRFWVPLLALYTGCRLEELCQLYRDDVQEIGGIWYLRIKGLTSAAMDEDEDDDQMLKTGSASRAVPLHPFIVDELKFPILVNKRGGKKGKRIFSELKKENFKYGHELSKWFNRRLRTKKVGVTDRKKTFHSFRHNVADHLYKKLVQESLIEELQGRAGKTETRRTYTTGQLVKNLYEQCILKLEYKVDLTHLKNSKFVPS